MLSHFQNPKRLRLQINCFEVDWQLSFLTQVCSSPFLLTSALEELHIGEPGHRFGSAHWKDAIENAQWLELLDLFTALKNLHLRGETVLRVFSALSELSEERVTEVLPALQNIFISGYLPEASRKAMKIFVAARRRSGHPVSVHTRTAGGEYTSWEDTTLL